MVLVQPGSVPELAASARRSFAEAFDREAQVVGRAPGRVNLIGEHTDYNAGLCLPVALRHATYAACGLRDDGVVRVTSRRLADTWTAAVDELGPGRVDGWAAYVAGVVWALAEDGLRVPGIDVYVDSQVPVGAGLSSSAAIECSVALAVAHLLDGPVSDEARRRLVAACVRAESEVAGAPTGGLDQTTSLLARPGSALLLDFADGSVTEVPVPIAAEGLRLLVIDTRVSHELTDGGYAARRADCEAAATALGIASLREAGASAVEDLADDRLRRRARHVVAEIARVRSVTEAIHERNWAAVGTLFLDSHASLRDDFEVSCPELDVAVTAAMACGAFGARMTGGGFGGSVIALLPDDRLVDVVDGVTAVFAKEGFRSPWYLLAEPGGGAEIV